ncbi:hypothetical protein [Spirosoma lituiforme]
MVYCVYEFKGVDRIAICQQPGEAEQILDQIHRSKEDVNPLGYMDENNDAHPYNGQTDLSRRIKKAANAYIQELSYGRG